MEIILFHCETELGPKLKRLFYFCLMLEIIVNIIAGDREEDERESFYYFSTEGCLGSHFWQKGIVGREGGIQNVKRKSAIGY